MVPVTVSPGILHTLAHRAGVREGADGWFASPLGTAIAAAAASRHPPGDRAAAEAALARLDSWRNGERRGRVSGDAAAVAVAERASAALGVRDRVRTRDAVGWAVDVAGRQRDIVPELHLALVVWGLDEAVPDRGGQPWVALRERLSRGRAHGVDGALRAYASSVAAERFDAVALVGQLLNELTMSPRAADGAVIVWLLTVAAERCARALPHGDSGLRTLVERRSLLVERLCAELDDDSFLDPDVPELDPYADEPAVPERLSSLEALLLDSALAPADPEDPWLTFPEAEARFGDDARTLRSRTRIGAAAGTLVVGVAVAVAVAAVLLLRGAERPVAASWATLPFSVSVVSAAKLVEPLAAGRRKAVDAFGGLGVTGALWASLLLADRMLAEPLLEGTTGAVVAVLAVGVAAFVWSVLRDPD